MAKKKDSNQPAANKKRINYLYLGLKFDIEILEKEIEKYKSLIKENQKIIKIKQKQLSQLNEYVD